MLETALQSLQDTRVATAIREGETLFPWIECVHVLALTLVIGSIAIVDRRLLGLRARDRSVHDMTAELLPITWTAFAAAALTGGLMFAANSVAYAHNVFFQAKIALIACAGLNMVAYQVFLGRHAFAWHEASLTPLPARIAGGVSLLLWLGVAACGRWIGFTLNEPA